MKKIKRTNDCNIIKRNEKLIAKLISRGYFLQDIFHQLKRNECFETSLFNFYKLIRSGRYPLIDNALKRKGKKT